MTEAPKPTRLVFPDRTIPEALAGRSTKLFLPIWYDPLEEFIELNEQGWPQRGDVFDPDVLVPLNPPAFAGRRYWVGESYDRSSNGKDLKYRADYGFGYMQGHLWSKGKTMAHWMSRLMVDVSHVRAVKFEEITEEDAIASGLPTLSKMNLWGPGSFHTALEAFKTSLTKFTFAPSGRYIRNDTLFWEITYAKVPT